MKAIPFRELKTGDTFRFQSAFNTDEIRRKVSWDKYCDVYNGEGFGSFVSPRTKKVRTRESKVIPLPNWSLDSHKLLLTTTPNNPVI